MTSTADLSANSHRIRTTCPRDCYDACGVIVEVADGRVLKVLGDPDHPVARGSLCTKCALAYNSVWIDPAARLLRPLRRVGPKGAASFEPVSWDEALALIAARLNPLLQSGRSAKILHTHYTGTCSVLAGNFPLRFFNAIGATEIDPDTVCNKAGHAALAAIFGTSLDGFDPRTLESARTLLIWGANPSTSAPHIDRHWVQSFTGTRIVVDPIAHPTARAADIHLQLRPGTDAALVFGLLHVIRRENLLDRTFIAASVRGWDAVESRLDDCTPEITAGITGVPAEKIIAAARAYARGPSMLWLGQGVQRQRRGGNVVRSVALLPAATGQIGRPGTGLLYMNGFRSRGMDIDYVTANHLRPPDAPAPISYMDLTDALVDPGRSAALFCWNNNIAASSPSQSALRAALSREDLFTVCCELFPTDTTAYADLILPAASFLEFDDLVASYFHYTLSAQNGTVPPFGDALPNQEIYRRLASALKLKPAELFETDHALIAELLRRSGVGLNFAGLSRRGTVDHPPSLVISFSDGRFPTRSGRIEIDAETFTAAGLPTAPSPEADAPPAKGKLRVLSPASPWLMNSSYGNSPANLRRLGPSDVRLHPDELGARGLADGDSCELVNSTGRLTLIARRDDTVPAGVALVHKSRWTGPGGLNVNVLNSGEKTDLAESTSIHSVEAECQPLPRP